MRVIALVLVLACSSPPKQPPPAPPPAVTVQRLVLPAPDGADLRTRHVVVYTRGHAGNIGTGTITVSSVLNSPPDVLSRPFPACIEVPPGTDAITVTSTTARDLAGQLLWDDEPDFDSECERARGLMLPPSQR